MSSIRSLLYTIAALLGDVQAIRRGRIGQRIVNRMVGRAVRSLLRGLMR